MDFSLTTLFVVPVGSSHPSTGSTQDLTPGQVGFFSNSYGALTSANIAASPYFYIAQGRANTYLQGSKRAPKLKGCATANCNSNVIEVRKTIGCPTAANQIIDIDNFNVKCGEVVTLTLRAHSKYIDTLFFNGLTRSVTVNAPCCDCDADPCETVDVPNLIDALIEKLEESNPGSDPAGVSLSDFFIFERIGEGDTAKLRIHGKTLATYSNPTDVATFAHEYDRQWFNAFVYSGPATSADFIVDDACNVVADVETIQEATYPTGTSAEIKQLEKNFYSYQTGYMKHLYRISGYNQAFESYVTDGTVYDTFVIRYKDFDKGVNAWSAAIEQDYTVIIAVPQAGTSALEAILEAAFGTISDENACITTTTTTTAAPPTTTTTTTAG